MREYPLSRIARILVCLTIMLLFVGTFTTPALATNPDPEHKVGLCHRTSSDTNPYVFISVDAANVPAHLGNLHGHPAKTNEDGSPRDDYRATSASECEVPASTPTPTPTATPTTPPTPSPTASASSTPTPTPTTASTPTLITPASPRPTPSPTLTPAPSAAPTVITTTDPTPTIVPTITTPIPTPSLAPTPTLPPTDMLGFTDRDDTRSLWLLLFGLLLAAVALHLRKDDR